MGVYNKINPVTPSFQIGPIVKNGALIVLDQQLPFFFKYVKIGVGGTDGDVVIEALDDETGIPYTYVMANVMKSHGLTWAFGHKVLSAGTTATNIYYYY